MKEEISRPQQTQQRLAVLIDADNISAALAGDIFKKVYAIGMPIARRAYGMVNCFASDGGWAKAQREYGVVARPQVSNVSGKNVADIALVIDAMEFLYRNPCEGICIVSNDSDFSALAAKIREGGKSAYGLGGAKTPASFRNACTEFIELPQIRKETSTKTKAAPSTCPRCGGKLDVAWTKSNFKCLRCTACGGMSAKIEALKKTVSAESMGDMIAAAKRHEQLGCVCPVCGESMSLLKVASGKKYVEIDVCGNCRTIWYDKGEFETLTPQDGLLSATVSAGKAYRRETVLAVAADIRSGRRKVPDVGSLKAILKSAYHVPMPDISPIISTLQCQRVIQVAKKGGKITVLTA
jgi:Zn-finger nucleic acid-binding protein